jgi:hypothetical protein
VTVRARLLVVAVSAAVLVLGVAPPAAAVTLPQKAAAMVTLTAPTAAGYSAWTAAWQNQGAWTAYGFDWSTDYCTVASDRPFGFDFRMACWRHDFGYRNYHAMGMFPENKEHVDKAFYFDLKAKCRTYSYFLRPSCNTLAWLYYQAVRNAGII